MKSRILLNSTAGALALTIGVAALHGYCSPHTVPMRSNAGAEVVKMSREVARADGAGESTRTTEIAIEKASASETPGAAQFVSKTEDDARFTRLALSKPDSLTDADGEFIMNYCQKHPNLSTAHSLLSVYLKKSGYYSLACDESAEAWRLNRNDPRLAYAAIKLLVDNSLEPDAAELALEAMKQYENNYESLINLVVVLQVEKQYEVALQVLQAAQKLRPDQPELILMRIHSLIALDRFDEAEAPATKLTELPRTRASGLLALGQIWQHRKNNEKAATYLRQAYALANTDPLTCKTLFQVLTDSGHHYEAREPGMMAVVKYTGSPEARQMKQTIIANMHKYDLRRIESVAETIAARLTDPKELSYLFYSVADIADNLGGVRHAIGYYQLGLQTNPKYGRAYMRLARDLEKAGIEPDRVTYLYVQAMQLAPQDKEVISALSRNEARSRGTRDFASRMKSSMRVVFPPTGSMAVRQEQYHIWLIKEGPSF